jgi:hypothetical protein
LYQHAGAPEISRRAKETGRISRPRCTHTSIVRAGIAVWQGRAVRALSAYAAMGCSILSFAACGETDPTPLRPSPNPPRATTPATLAGQVFDVTAEGRVAVPDLSVLGVFLTARPGGPGPWFGSYRRTATGSDGRYVFPDVPAGAAIGIVRIDSSAHRQLCGATAELGAATDLDVEITSNAGRQQRSAGTLTPLRVTGQVYEMTPAGHVGIEGAEIYTEWAPDGPFVSFYTRANGLYTTCGIPRDWPIGFEASKPGYVGLFLRRAFHVDSTLDFELERQ